MSIEEHIRMIEDCVPKHEKRPKECTGKRCWDYCGHYACDRQLIKEEE